MTGRVGIRGGDSLSCAWRLAEPIGKQGSFIRTCVVWNHPLSAWKCQSDLFLNGGGHTAN